MVDSVIITVFVVWFVLYFISFKKRKTTLLNYSPSLDMTNLLKGFASLTIILHHFSLRYNNIFLSDNHIVNTIGKLGGTFSLIIFFFLSGYGITISELSKQNIFKSFLKKRIFKIYKPLLLVGLITFIIYTLLNVTSLSLEVQRIFRLPDSILIIGKGTNWIYNVLYVFGLIDIDWYVAATLVFYIIFYISFNYPISFTLNKNINISILFILLMIIYYIMTYIVIGASLGHYYRNSWAFMVGVLFALYSKVMIERKLLFSLLLIGLLSFNQFMEGILYTVGSIISICFLIIMFWLDKNYESKSKILLYLGSISYFIYLVHIRIVYNTLWYFSESTSILLYLFSTFVVSIIVRYIYNFIEKTIFKNQ